MVIIGHTTIRPKISESERRRRERAERDRLEKERATTAGRAGVPAVAFTENRAEARGLVRAEEIGLNAEREKTEVSTQLSDPDSIAAQLNAAAQERELTSVEKQFLAQGGFQPLETRTERASERVAEFGLKIPEVVAKEISRRTGIPLAFKNAEELSETPLGKVLGITIAALTTTMIGASVLPSVGAGVAAASSKIGAALGLKSGTVLTGGVIGVTAFTGLQAGDYVDVFLKRENLEDIQGGLSEYGEMGSDIAALYQGTSFENRLKGIAKIEQMLDVIDIMEYKGQQAALLDPQLLTNGEYSVDFVSDLENKRAALIDSAEAILGGEGTELTADDKLRVLEQLEDRRKDRRQELIEAGFLKEVLV